VSKLLSQSQAQGAVLLREIYKAPHSAAFPGALCKVLPQLAKHSWTVTRRVFVCLNEATDGRFRVFMVMMIEVREPEM
jgi:hypothetical protein